MDDPDKREKGAANARAVGWAAVVGAVCGAPQGAFSLYLLVGNAYLVVVDVIVDGDLGLDVRPGRSDIRNGSRSVGFRFITGKL